MCSANISAHYVHYSFAATSSSHSYARPHTSQPDNEQKTTLRPRMLILITIQTLQRPLHTMAEVCVYIF